MASSKRDQDNPTLDPQDWEAYRRLMHEVVDACVDHLSQVRERPWQPVDEAFHDAIDLGGRDVEEGVGLEATARTMVEQILPHHSGNTHPGFFGWVQGSGTAAGVMAEIVAATMNSNCGGRDHGAVYVEREVIRWCARTFGFPEESSGVLVTGTSQATVLALAVARANALGEDVKTHGLASAPKLTVLAAEGVHVSTLKAVELLGLGAESVRAVAVDPATGAMDPAALQRAIEATRASGRRPWCVVASAGTVDIGAFDPLDAIADVCERENLWLHVDGAFGAWARLADAPWSDLVDGMDRADSLSFDFHKWMFVPYDCGVVLIKDAEAHRAAFSQHPAYLDSHETGLAGGSPWYSDYGVDLSRGFRALKVWATLQTYGSRRLGEVVTWNCRQAREMERSIDASPTLEMMAPVAANVVCFGVAGIDDDATASELNKQVAQKLQLAGTAVFSTTQIGSRTAIRAAITNQRTQNADVERAIRGAEDEAEALRRDGSPGETDRGR